LKKINKLLSVLICVVMVFSAIPFTGTIAAALTEGDYTYTVNNSEATITDCVSSVSGEITIPSTLGGYPVTTIGVSAFEGCTGVTSVIIPSSVKTIYFSAFAGCTKLKNINIPNSVTKLGESVFKNCSSLTSIKIPESLTTIPYYTFYNCTSLSSITLPDTVTNIVFDAFTNTAFYNNSANWKNGVLYIGNHLIAAKSTISGSYAIKDGTKTIAFYAFYNCTNLTNITIPSSVENIGTYAFFNTGYYNKQSNWENNVLYIGDCCIESKSNITGNITLKSGTRVIADRAFDERYQLESIMIPNAVTSIGDWAFSFCPELKTVFYCGTEDEWNKISIKDNNESLTNAKRNYHNYEWTIILEYPTCSTEGEELFYCSICKHEELGSIAINPENHEFADDFTIDKEATFIEDGSKSRHCTLCEEVTDVTTIPNKSYLLNAEYLVTVKKSLFAEDEYNIDYDINSDKNLDILDLICLKNILLK